MDVQTNREKYFPLSASQKGLWFISKLMPNSVSYNVPHGSTIIGNFDENIFKSTIVMLLEENDNLRLRFSLYNDEPVQYISSSLFYTLSVESCCGMDDEAFSRHIKDVVKKPFNLENDPLIRFYLFKKFHNVNYFLFVVPHIFMDGTSVHNIFTEIQIIYKRIMLGVEPRKKRNVPTYDTFVAWQAECFSQSRDVDRKYWEKELSGEIPILNLPYDNPTNEKGGYYEIKGEMMRFQLSQPLFKKIKKQQQQGVRASAIFLSVYLFLLHRYTGQHVVVTGMPVSGRNNPKLRSIIGQLVNMVPIRSEIDYENSVSRFIDTIQSKIKELVKHGDYPFSEIKNNLELGSSQQLFQSVFAYHNYFNRGIQLEDDWFGGELSFVADYSVRQTGEYNIVFELLELRNEIILNIKYDGDLFYARTISQLGTHFLHVVERFFLDKEQKLADIDIITSSEHQKIVYDWNATEKNYNRDVLLHELFEASVRKSPDAMALSFHGRSFSYDTLNCSANRLANNMIEKGAEPGEFVALIIERSVEMVEGVLGILKAGCAYVPIEPSMPKSRISYILKSLKVRFVVTNIANFLNLKNTYNDLLHVDFIYTLDIEECEEHPAYESSNSFHHIPAERIADYSSKNPGRQACSNDLAYVIFTSGTTGTPKGVMVKHKPVINVIEWLNNEFGVSHKDKILFITSISFDISVYDLFGLFAAGGTVYLASKDDITNPELVYNIIYNDKITIWDSAPAALQILISYFTKFKEEKKDPALRLVLVGGDYIPLTMPNDMKRRFPLVNFISLGGATEATLWSNYYPVKKMSPRWKTIPYGKPIQNSKYYILNDNKKVQPIGVAGDLYIGGECLSSGYINDEKLTNEKFIGNPFCPGEKIYFTGDIAKWNNDGNIEFLGRMDSQVKIRGFRVELSEIQMILLQHPKVKDAVLLARKFNNGDRLICAYYIPKSEVTADELKNYLEEELPRYMVPSFIVEIKTIPSTSNGKIDRNALPEPTIALSSKYIQPRTDIEKEIVKIYQVALNFDEQIGIRDDFFSLGGHSLLAVKIISQINKSFKAALSVADIFKNPTVEMLAGRIETDPSYRVASPLLLLKEGRGKYPLFFIHPGGGDATCFLHLSRLLEKERPVYAIEAHGLNTEERPLESIEAMAEAYLMIIEKIHTGDGFLLGGFCAGGTIAYEMAQQLKSKHRHIDFLFLIDALSPNEYHHPGNEGEFYASFLRDIGPSNLLSAYQMGRNIKSDSLFDAVSKDLDLLAHKDRIDIFYHLFKQAGLSPIDPEQVERRFKIYKTCFTSMINYQAPQIDASMIIWKAIGHKENKNSVGLMKRFSELEYLGWDGLIKKIPILHAVPGNHFSILQNPNVEIIANTMNPILRSLP